MTQIEEEIEEIRIDKVAMINNERVMVSVSKDGYVKRVSLRSYGASEKQLPGLKEGDHLIGYQEVDTLDHIVFFTSAGTYGYLPMYEVEESKWKDVGMHFNSKIKMNAEEKIINAFIVPSFDTDGYFVSVSKNGLIKKTAISEFEVSRNNKTMACMNLSDDDVMIGTYLAYEEDEVLLASHNGYVSRYPLALVPKSATRSKGVKAMNLSDDTIASMTILTKHSSYVLVVNETGGMKRVKSDEIIVLGRPVKGNLIHKKVKSNPSFIRYIKGVNANDAVCFIDQVVHDIEAKEIAIMSKDATFSNALKLDADFYLMKQLTKVEKKAKPIIVEKQEEREEKVEELHLEF